MAVEHFTPGDVKNGRNTEGFVGIDGGLHPPNTHQHGSHAHAEHSDAHKAHNNASFAMAKEICYCLLEEFGIFDFYRAVGVDGAWVEFIERDRPSEPLDKRNNVEGDTVFAKVPNVVVGCCWTINPPKLPPQLNDDLTAGESIVGQLVKVLDVEVPALLAMLRRLEIQGRIPGRDVLAAVEKTSTPTDLGRAQRLLLRLMEQHNMPVDIRNRSWLRKSDSLSNLVVLVDVMARSRLSDELQRLNAWHEYEENWGVPRLCVALRVARGEEAGTPQPDSPASLPCHACGLRTERHERHAVRRRRDGPPARALSISLSNVGA